MEGYITAKTIMRRRGLSLGAVRRAIARYNLDHIDTGKYLYVSKKDAHMAWGL